MQEPTPLERELAELDARFREQRAVIDNWKGPKDAAYDAADDALEATIVEIEAALTRANAVLLASAGGTAH